MTTPSATVSMTDKKGHPVAETIPPAEEDARAFLSAPVACADAPDSTTAGGLLAAFLWETFQAEPRFAPWKTALYVAAVRAGLVHGVEVDDAQLGIVNLPRAEALTEAAVRLMGKPDDLAGRLRSMITAKQQPITEAGASRGLAEDWQQATFTGAELLALLAGGEVPGGE